MNMMYQLAAALALALELLIAGDVIDLPVLHMAGPLTATGAAFILAFVMSEIFDAADVMVKRWRVRR